MTRSGRLMMVAALALGLTGAANAGDVTGTWTAEFDTMVGVQKYTYTFEVDGETLSGKALGERAGEKAEEVILKDVKLEGDTLSFVEMLDFQGQEIPITYEGTVAGDEIKFTRKVGDFATEELVAKRKKD